MGGCFENDDPGYYEQAKPGWRYDFNYVPIEVRSKYDPYTAWAESEYNLGRDLTIFFWLSLIFLSSAFLLTLVLSYCFCFVVKKNDG